VVVVSVVVGIKGVLGGGGGGAIGVPLCVPEDVFMGLRQPVRDGVECWT